LRMSSEKECKGRGVVTGPADRGFSAKNGKKKRLQYSGSRKGGIDGELKKRKKAGTFAWGEDLRVG